jgi:hypothetical protein
MDLSSYDQQTLARWWCEFNSYRWPIDFLKPEPPGFRRLGDFERYKLPAFRRAFAAVEAAVPTEVALAYWKGPYRMEYEERMGAAISAASRRLGLPGDLIEVITAADHYIQGRSDRP